LLLRFAFLFQSVRFFSARKDWTTMRMDAMIAERMRKRRC
jgi:hypothetical protein